MDLHKAIRSIHNDVVTINGNDQSDIVAKDNNGDEVSINPNHLDGKKALATIKKLMK